MEILYCPRNFPDDFHFENFPVSGFDTNNRHINDFLSQMADSSRDFIIDLP